VEAKKNNNRRLWVGVLLVGSLIGAALLAGCLPARSARAEESLAGKEVAQVFVGSLAAEVSASGQLLAQRDARLSFASPGRVREVAVAAGDVVRAGDELVRLEDDALQRAVRSAEQSLAMQRANLAELQRPADAEDVAAAEAAVASAQARVDDLLAGPSAEELADAQANLASAQATLDDLLQPADAVDLNQAQTALAAARAAAAAEAARYAALDAQTRVARQQLDLAAVDLKSARYFYEALKNDWQHKDYADFSPEYQAFKDAQTAYDVVLARYNLSLANLNASALRGAEAQVAQANLTLANLTGDKSVEVASARAQLAAAQATLAALVEEKTTQIASARAQLASAQASLDNLLQGASAEKLAVAQAQVEQAQIQLDSARSRLDKATLWAPFAGIVTAVYVEAGEVATGLAVEMIDPASVEVVLEVDEVDIGSIALDQETRITLEAWPDRELGGHVSAIAPKARTQSDVSVYEVHIGLDTADLPVRVGMTANADLVTARRDNVLLVANTALIANRSTGAYTVQRVVGETVQDVEVTVGLRDKGYTEITGGLREGDQVVIQ
jgi:HlyD family secretion protein